MERKYFKIVIFWVKVLNGLITILGVLAQLGARYIRIVKATGSTPVYSMNKSKAEIKFSAFSYCNDFNVSKNVG